MVSQVGNYQALPSNGYILKREIPVQISYCSQQRIGIHQQDIGSYKGKARNGVNNCSAYGLGVIALGGGENF